MDRLLVDPGWPASRQHRNWAVSRMVHSFAMSSAPLAGLPSITTAPAELEPSGAVIALSRVTRRYRSAISVARDDHALAPGECLSLLGPSGGDPSTRSFSTTPCIPI